MTDAPARDSEPRDPEAGITLVEMLVALALFALVGLASFAVLDTVIRTRDGTEGRLDAVAALDRALILFGRDVMQSDPGGQTLGDGVLAVTLRGAGGPGALSYALVDGALERRVGGPDGDGPRQRLVPAGAATFRAIDAAGGWHDAWPPEAEDAPPLVGVEMVLAVGEGADAPTVRRLVEVARPAEPSDEALPGYEAPGAEDAAADPAAPSEPPVADPAAPPGAAP